MCKCVIQKTIARINTDLSSSWNTVSKLPYGKIVLTANLIFSWHVRLYILIYTPAIQRTLLPRARLQQQQLPLWCSKAHAGPSPGAVPERSDPELRGTNTAARWYLVISTDSPCIHEYFRSIQSSKHWRSKKCSQLCFLKDTAMLTLFSILQRC